jgi:ABC-type transport system involved in multi-copper enzyme maturation permease subunit
MSTILTLAGGTFGEAIRRKILNVFLFVALAVMVVGFAFMSFTTREQLVIVKSMGLGIISIAGVFISVILGINLVPNEIEKRTIYTILSKPVTRYEFLVGKFLGGLATVLFNIVLMGIAFIVITPIELHLVSRVTITLADWLPVMQGVLMIFFQLMLVNAVALLFSVFLSPFVNFFLSFAIYLLGSMSTVTESLATPGKDKNPIVVGIFKAIHFLVPNFGNFNIQNPIIHPDIQIADMAKYIMVNILYAIIYTLIMLLIAVLIFDRREV